jgi:hypothetical protein
MDDVTVAALFAPCFLAPFFLELSGAPQRVCGAAGLILAVAAIGLVLTHFQVRAPSPYGFWISLVLMVGVLAVSYRQWRGWAYRKNR